MVDNRKNQSRRQIGGDMVAAVQCRDFQYRFIEKTSSQDTNYALMAFSSSSPDSEVSNDSICSKSCLKMIESLKSQNDQLLKDLKKFELMVLGYKTGLKSVEEKLEVGNTTVSRQAQQVEPAVGQDGSGGSGVGAVIGLSVADCAGGASVGVGSQGSSHTRWRKIRVQTVRIGPQKTTPTQSASQPSTSSQVPASKTRNKDEREIGDGIPTQSNEAGDASEWSFM
ncbi:hypothetical protein Tco_1449210 [Tanacetum coccineum]